MHHFINTQQHALQPAASALCRAASVFSGASLPPALCPTTSGLPGRASFQGAGSTMTFIKVLGRTLACPGPTDNRKHVISDRQAQCVDLAW